MLMLSVLTVSLIGPLLISVSTELFSMIARLNADTLQDQRINTEATSPSPKPSPKPQKKSSPSLRLKKPNKSPSPKFSRTKSGAAIPSKKEVDVTRQAYSPPPSLHQNPHQRYPPAPASDPPTLPSHHLNHPGSWDYVRNPHALHQHQTSDSLSGISMGSGSSVDSISHELATDRQVTRHQLREWVMSRSSRESSGSSSVATGTPLYFPNAHGNGTLERSMGGIMPSQAGGYYGPREHGQSAGYPHQQLGQAHLQGGNGGQAHFLDSVVSEAYSSMPQKQGTWPPSGHPAQQQQPAMQLGYHTMGVMPSNTAVPASNYPWRYVHESRVHPQAGSGVSSIGEDCHALSDSGSGASMTSSSAHMTNQQLKPPLSPTTHVLVVDDQPQNNETFV